MYEIEKWSLALATFVHYISIMAVFTAASFGLGWFSESLIAYFIAVSCETVGFAIIWIIMYSLWKKTVKEMNEELKKYKEEEEFFRHQRPGLPHARGLQYGLPHAVHKVQAARGFDHILQHH